MINLKRYIILLIPLFYGIYIGYCRLIIRDARDLDLPKTTLQIWLYSLLIILTIIRLYVLLKNLGFIKRPPLKNKYLLQISSNLLKLIDKWDQLWINFYQTLLDFYFPFNLWLLYVIRKLYYGQNYLKYFVIFFDILPQILVAIFFLIDIVIFTRFCYFYYTIPLLLLPLIATTFRSMILQFHLDNRMSIAKAVIVLNVDKDAGTIEAQFAPDFMQPDYVKDLSDFMRNHYIPVIGSIDILLNYTILKKKFYYDYIITIISIMYLIGWATLLFIF